VIGVWLSTHRQERAGWNLENFIRPRDILAEERVVMPLGLIVWFDKVRARSDECHQKGRPKVLMKVLDKSPRAFDTQVNYDGWLAGHARHHFIHTTKLTFEMTNVFW